MKHLKTAGIILLLVAATGLVSAAQPDQSHNLSEIDPVDIDFNMSSYGVFNASSYELQDGLNISGYTIYDQGGVKLLSYDTGNSEWDVKNSDIDLNGNPINDSSGAVTIRGDAEIPNGYLDVNSPTNTGAALDVGGAIHADGGIDSYSGLDMNGNSITGIGGLNNCGSNEALLGDGTCGSTGGGSLNLSEVLTNGNKANQSIDMNGNEVQNANATQSFQLPVGADAY